MYMSKSLASAVSFFGTTILVTVFAWSIGGYEILFPELLRFFTLQIEALETNYQAFIPGLALCLALLPIDLFLSLIAGHFQQVVLGKAKSHVLSDCVGLSGFRRFLNTMNFVSDEIRQDSERALQSPAEPLFDWMTRRLGLTGLCRRLASSVGVYKTTEEAEIFKKLFLVMIFEEVIARWLFLGVIWQIPFLHNSFWLVILVVVGNTFWSLLHLGNYEDESERHWLRTAPQFVSGIFFTFVYLKYDLLVTILFHTAANAILFSNSKKQETDIKDLIITTAAALMTWLAYSKLNAPLGDVLKWFTSEPTFELPGWEWWDYVWLVVLVSFAFRTVFGLLLYDRNNIGIEKSESSGSSDIPLGCGLLLIGVLIFVFLFFRTGYLYAAFWLLCWIGISVPNSVALIALTICFKRKGSSGSCLARTLWVTFPSSYIYVCALQAVGFKGAMWLILTTVAIEIPYAALRKIDD